jgi:hypothetical protein
MSIQEITSVRPAGEPFSFLTGLPSEVQSLLEIGTRQKVAAFDAGARFLHSERGGMARDRLVGELVAAGYPEISARQEVGLLPSLLSGRRLDAMIGNQNALPGGAALLDGQCVPIAPGVTVAGFPVGPVVVIGSGNAFLPAVSVSVQALLASCPVALRGSRLNQRVLERLVEALRAAGHPVLSSLMEHLHLFFADHRDPGENRQLHALLRTGPFDAGVFWGGREMLDAVLPQFAANPRHPLAIPMEPLTGVALITQHYVERARHALAEAAHELSESMVVFGQQLCSSPTEAYFVGDHSRAEDLAAALAVELAQSPEASARMITDRQAVLLDRVRDRCEELGAAVHTPTHGSAAWTVVSSQNTSVFEQFPADLCLPIHDRHGFLELICVPDIETAADRIAALSAAPCHAAIKQVQTVLRLADLADAQRLARLLRPRRGIYRVVPPDYVAARHPMEPADGQHFLSQFTRRTIIF